MPHITTTITAEQAQATLDAVKARFATYRGTGDDEPTLYEPGFHASGWTIAWSSGPYEWTLIAFGDGFNAEMYYEAINAGYTQEQARRLATYPAAPAPDGVFPEPVSNWCLGLYPTD